MTGIERLRDLASARIVDNRNSKTLHAELCSIANQIASEHDEDCHRMGLTYVTVSRVVADMERHVLGHEGMEDSPVARWARELREALAGHEDEEVEDVATVRADAMEAWRWVREHGGLEMVKSLIETNVWAHSLAIIAHDALFGEDDERDVTPTEFKYELERRLMPEGCEWPRFEDGARLAFEDKLPDFAHTIYKTVKTVKFRADGTAELTNAGGSANVAVIVLPGERVKRPAPKVLDADGVEIEAGDDLYSVEGMLKFHVSAIDKKSGRIATEAMLALDKWADPKMYTHRAPVLAADGRPLREGETVYDKDTGDRFEVDGFSDGYVMCTDVDACESDLEILPSQLTHTKPEIDTFERLEEDAHKDYVDYWKCDRIPCWACPAIADGKAPDERYNVCDCAEAVKCDIVRRAKALAGVGE